MSEHGHGVYCADECFPRPKVDAKLFAEMRDMLLKLEWSAYDGSAGVGYCPSCKHVEPLELGMGEGHGKHADDCSLGALLERIR